MSSDDPKLKAFDFLKEATVQQITLALGTVVFSATFYKDILSGHSKYHLLIEGSWLLFAFSIISGVLVVGALAWQLNDTANQNLDLYTFPAVRWTVLSQWLTFFPAVFTFALFVALNMSQSSPETSPTALAGPVLAAGPLTSTGPITAKGLVSIAGPLTATGSITATGPVTIARTGNPRPSRKRHQHNRALSVK